MSRLRTLDQLSQAGFDVEGLAPVIAQYDVGISAEMLGQIHAANDPIGLQFIPSVDELDIQNDEYDDPTGDDPHSPVRGIVHRYPDRVLFKVSSVCAVYCRYCFRREKIGVGSDHLRPDDFEAALDYIAEHPEIWEVILTGGDPFTLSGEKLKRIVDRLNGLEHVKVLRIHSRIPIASPYLITDTILSVLKLSLQSVQVVLHVNHADEMTDKAALVLKALRKAGCSLSSQSVLLRGVNDRSEVLEALFRTLIEHNVQPYYLHHLDRAKGTSRFRVSLEAGQALMQDLQGRVSGICLPRYMLDLPGGYGKVPINPSSVRRVEEGRYEVTDYRGGVHIYEEGEV